MPVIDFTGLLIALTERSAGPFWKHGDFHRNFVAITCLFHLDKAERLHYIIWGQIGLGTKQGC